jgi:hypothetical protein
MLTWLYSLSWEMWQVILAHLAVLRVQFCVKNKISWGNSRRKTHHRDYAPLLSLRVGDHLGWDHIRHVSFSPDLRLATIRGVTSRVRILLIRFRLHAGRIQVQGIYRVLGVHRTVVRSVRIDNRFFLQIEKPLASFLPLSVHLIGPSYDHLHVPNVPPALVVDGVSVYDSRTDVLEVPHGGLALHFARIERIGTLRLAFDFVGRELLQAHPERLRRLLRQLLGRRIDRNFERDLLLLNIPDFEPEPERHRLVLLVRISQIASDQRGVVVRSTNNVTLKRSNSKTVNEPTGAHRLVLLRLQGHVAQTFRMGDEQFGLVCGLPVVCHIRFQNDFFLCAQLQNVNLSALCNFT